MNMSGRVETTSLMLDPCDFNPSAEGAITVMEGARAYASCWPRARETIVRPSLHVFVAVEIPISNGFVIFPDSDSNAIKAMSIQDRHNFFSNDLPVSFHILVDTHPIIRFR